jgi:glycosyltransferase involved in cell wall biosynthesis
MTFTLSVIIPAYNVESFIEKAVCSAIIQKDVFEVIVVNDGSTDKTLEILDELKQQFLQLKVYHHKNNVNKGRSASRNLGIQKATGNYIAFLDADDFYLNKRFTYDKQIIEKDNTVDGVYNAVGFHNYRQITDEELKNQKLNTVTKKIPCAELFDSIVSSKYGYLHLDGLMVKKSVFKVIGFFNEKLVVAEDSDIIFKMALKCKLEPGIIHQPLALRGIHETNIFTNKKLYKKYNVKLYESLVNWSCKNAISLSNIDTLLNWLWVFKFKETPSLSKYIIYWMYLFANNPKLIFSKLIIKYFPLVRLRQIYFPFLYSKRKTL